ncbi:MAG TPA: MFS transporter [Burkholderiales bacterium]|nr:MFS transporter [Burkholderiales bacterium]
MTEASSPRSDPIDPPKSFAALRHPQYRIYFIATALAMMADNIEHVISYWMLYQKFHSPTLGGIAVLTHWLPFLLFSVYSGALADRFDTRRIIQVGMLFFMAASLGWAVLFYVDAVEEWHAVVLLTIHGMAGVLWGPASQLLIHDIVGVKDLQSAVRLNATSRQLGVLMGPAIGGGLMLLCGPSAGLFINVLFYLPLIIWLWKVPYGARKPRAPEARKGTPNTGGLASALATLRMAQGNRALFSMILLAGVSSFFVGNAFQAQMPEFAHDLGTEKADFSYSMLLAANAAGAFIGGMILESRGLLQAHARTAIVLTILWCFSIAGFALTDNYPLALALMFVAGFLNLTFNAMAQTLVQIHAPPQLRGRMIGLYNMSNNGLRAFSGVTVGILGAVIGIHSSLALSALLLLLCTGTLLAFTLRVKS